MGTRGLEIVRFYILYHQYDGYFEGLGAKIVAAIPADGDGYHNWLTATREKYATRERALEETVYEIRDGIEPDHSQYDNLFALPSELPRLGHYDAEYIYIINLDLEILTMNNECNSNHLDTSPGWLDQDWAGDRAPLLEFGSMSHLPDKLPGKAITEAVTYGLKQGRANFQIVVLSLFKVAFAEAFFFGGDGEPFVEVSKAIPLSPLRAAYCVSTHPRERPELKDNMEAQRLAALVNFFDVAARRRTTSKTRGILPLELHDRILDFVDYDTWKNCSVISQRKV
ncbi:f-box domain-containing protein [Fusarium coicis]|nr:f-box domain-containing protein [Fusarium coicis]